MEDFGDFGGFEDYADDCYYNEPDDFETYNQNEVEDYRDEGRDEYPEEMEFELGDYDF